MADSILFHTSTRCSANSLSYSSHTSTSGKLLESSPGLDRNSSKTSPMSSFEALWVDILSINLLNNRSAAIDEYFVKYVFLALVPDQLKIVLLVLHFFLYLVNKIGR